MRRSTLRNGCCEFNDGNPSGLVAFFFFSQRDDVFSNKFGRRLSSYFLNFMLEVILKRFLKIISILCTVQSCKNLHSDAPHHVFVRIFCIFYKF